MKGMSNGIIAVLLLVAIAISGFGLLTVINLGQIKVTGGATGTGSANVTITGAVGIEMVRNYTDFGDSSLDAAQRIITTQDDNYGTFDDGTEGNESASSYGACTGSYDEANCAFPFVVRNTGNVNASINVSADKEAGDVADPWIVQGAGAYIKGKNNESAACGMNFTGMAGFGEGSWMSLNETERLICTSLDYRDTPDQDEIRIHFNLTIPSDTIGSKGVIVTVGAIQAP